MKTRLLALLLCVTLLSGCGGSSGAAAPDEDGYDGLVFSAEDRGGETWDRTAAAKPGIRAYSSHISSP